MAYKGIAGQCLVQWRTVGYRESNQINMTFFNLNEWCMSWLQSQSYKANNSSNLEKNNFRRKGNYRSSYNNRRKRNNGAPIMVWVVGISDKIHSKKDKLAIILRLCTASDVNNQVIFRYPQVNFYLRQFQQVWYIILKFKSLQSVCL